LKKCLAPFPITHFYTDDWATYERHLEAEQPTVGKANTQKIERKKPQLTNLDQAVSKENHLFLKTRNNA
jgi:insertion element IS1 protein InsB